MSRLTEWMDLSELGDLTSLYAGGWVFQAGGGGGNPAVDGTTRYRDPLNNGGSFALSIGGTGEAGMKTPILTSPVSTFYVRFHYRITSLSINNYPQLFHWFEPTGSSIGALGYDASGHLKIYSGDPNAGGTLLATSTNVLAIDTWYTIEVRMTIGNSGTYEVRVDGTSTGWIPSASGDTQPGAATTVNRLLFWKAHNSNGHSVWFDDIAADDSSFCGEGLISALSPTGVGNTTQLTPSTGANWENVDEIPPSDAQYNYTLLANKKDTYEHASLPASALSVSCVYLASRVVRVGSSISTAYSVIRSNGADYEDGGQALATSPTVIKAMWEEDPDTSNPWSVTAVNDSEIGIRFDA